MAELLSYTGDEPLTFAQVAAHCRLDDDDSERELIEQVLIPAARQQAEVKTGAALRQAIYREYWPTTRPIQQRLDKGQVRRLIGVGQFDLSPDSASYGAVQPLAMAGHIVNRNGEAFLHLPGPRPAGVLVVDYEAGADLSIYPGAVQWLLLTVAALYENRESLIVGNGAGVAIAELPPRFTDSLLAPLTLPSLF